MTKSTAIFGGTSAIAVGVARVLAMRGEEFVLVGRNLQKLELVAADLRARGAAKVDNLVADLGDVSAHATLFMQLKALAPALDRIVIAYGSLGDQKSGEQHFSEAYKELNTNFLSVVSLLTHFANWFQSRKMGSIAVVTSVAGDRGRKSNYIYGSAKGALGIFLQGLRNRLAKDGVQVLTIKPGFIDTPMTSHIRKGALFASPEAIAPAIVRAFDRRADVIYVPGFWRVIMAIICSIPESIFKRLSI